MGAFDALQNARKNEYTLAQMEATRRSTLEDVATKSQDRSQSADKHPLTLQGLQYDNRSKDLSNQDAAHDLSIKQSIGVQAAAEAGRADLMNKKLAGIENFSKLLKSEMRTALQLGPLGGGKKRLVRVFEQLGKTGEARQLLMMSDDEVYQKLGAAIQKMDEYSANVRQQTAINNEASVNRRKETELSGEQEQRFWKERNKITNTQQRSLARLKAHLAAKAAEGKLTTKGAKTYEARALQLIQEMKNAKTPQELAAAVNEMEGIQKLATGDNVSKKGVMVEGTEFVTPSPEKLGTSGKDIAATVLGKSKKTSNVSKEDWIKQKLQEGIDSGKVKDAEKARKYLEDNYNKLRK